MKKLSTTLLLVLCAALCMTFTGCNKKSTAKTEATTPATILAQDFLAITKADNSISLESLADKLVSNEIIPFGPAIMEVEEGYLNGFTSEVTGFSEGMMFGPMIGSIPFIGYVFKTDKSADLISSLKEKADLRWNVCTQADEMVTESSKDYVFFVMAPANFDEF